MERVEHDGRTTAYERGGEDGCGASVVYVHGSGADGGLWRGQLARGGRPRVALDLSGHGESADVGTDPGYETLSAYADDVLAVYEETDASVLVGNSLGGAVCLHLVLERDVSPAALVLAGSGAKLAVADALLGWLDDDFERAIAFLHGPDRLFRDPTADTLDRSKTTMRAVGRAVTRRDFRSCHTFDVRDRLGDLGVPVLAVCGDHDELTPPRYHEYLAENVEDGSFETVPRAAHLAMVERSDAFDEAVGGFLDRVE